MDDILDDQAAQEEMLHELCRQCAQTILRQLGGQRFFAMTGASQPVTLNDMGVQMILPARLTKSRRNRLLIQLDARTDTYRLTAFRSSLSAAQPAAAKLVREGVFAADLRRVFTEMTGLATSL